jgi:hypothetical protein
MEETSVFTHVDYALEEAEFLAKQTGRPHSVVGLPTLDSDEEHYTVLETSRAVATAAVILETIRVILDEQGGEGH